MNKLQELQQQAREKFENQAVYLLPPQVDRVIGQSHKIGNLSYEGMAFDIEEFLDELVASTYLAALKAAEGAVPASRKRIDSFSGHEECRTETLKNLSSLKKV